MGTSLQAWDLHYAVSVLFDERTRLVDVTQVTPEVGFAAVRFVTFATAENEKKKFKIDPRFDDSKNYVSIF